MAKSDSPVKKEKKSKTKFDTYATRFLEGDDPTKLGIKARGPLCYQHFMLRAKALRDAKLR